MLITLQYTSVRHLWIYSFPLPLAILIGGTPDQAKDIVVAPGEPFFTANGSYFVFWGLRRSCMAGLGVAA